MQYEAKAISFWCIDFFLLKNYRGHPVEIYFNISVSVKYKRNEMFNDRIIEFQGHDFLFLKKCKDGLSTSNCEPPRVTEFPLIKWSLTSKHEETRQRGKALPFYIAACHQKYFSE